MTALKELLSLATQRELTEDERLGLINGLRASSYYDAEALLSESMSRVEAEEGIDPELALVMLANIFAEGRSAKLSVTSKPRERIYYLRKWWWAAASIILLGTISYFRIHSDDNAPQLTKVQPEKIDVGPAKSGAILILENGTQVVLDSLSNGMIAAQNGSLVNLKNGRLSYDPSGPASGQIASNTMTTPKGRQFQLMLPDGSEVWLNAASSITYPTAFTGASREVHVSGEAYFRVAKDKQKPFLVTFSGSQIEVLGTSFNVSAYENEIASQTTLIEGAVKIRAGGKVLKLKPGQQAVKTNDLTLYNEPNIKQVLAWRNGVFDFNGLEFTACMRQLERWYDIKVVYDNEIPRGTFLGKIDRNLTLSQAIKLLDGIVAKFRLEGRILHVLPK